MTTTPKGYAAMNETRIKGYWREIEPTAASLIEALAVLPPDTRLEVGGSYDGPDEPSGIWYYPNVKEAHIG